MRQEVLGEFHSSCPYLGAGGGDFSRSSLHYKLTDGGRYRRHPATLFHDRTARPRTFHKASNTSLSQLRNIFKPSAPVQRPDRGEMSRVRIDT